MKPVVYESFITNKEADLLISTIDNNFDKFVFEGQQSYFTVFGQDNFHVSHFFNIPQNEHDIFPESKDLIKQICQKIENKINNDTGKDVHMSVTWFVKTLEGKFSAHTDNEPGAIYPYKHTTILYLNDCLSSGAINFPEWDFKFYPKKGSLISFDSETLHEVLPIKEARYSMASWFTDDIAYRLFS